MRATVLLLVVAACSDPGEEDGFELHAAITAGSQFDHLDIFMPVSQLDGPGILTPALLATNTPAPAIAMIWAAESTPIAVGLDAAATYTYENWFLFGAPDEIAALGQRQIAGGAPEPVGFAMIGLSYVVKPGCCDEADVTLPLADVTAVEKWGTFGSLGGTCLRVVDGSGATTYIVSDGDRDCDGIPNEQDCKPDAYCDPSAISGPAHDACTCT